MRSKSIATILFIVFFASLSAAHAKEEMYLEPADEDWGSLDAAQDVRNPRFNTAYYGWVGDEADVDAFHFAFDVDVDNFMFTISVPQCADQFEAFYPSVAIVGAGLETPEDASLPFDLPEGTGALIFDETHSTGIRQVSRSEPYNLYFAHLNSVDLPAGDYWVAVYDAEARAGAYIFRTMYEHPEFTDFTDDDWDEMEAAYSTIANHGWVSSDCGAPQVSAQTS